MVLVGGFGWKDKNNSFDFENNIRDNTIFWIKYQPKEVVTYLMSSARLLIYPSFYEGFGFPPLEALKSNTPVLCSNIPTLKEILKNHASYADNGDVDSFFQNLKKFTEISKTENKRLQEGQSYSKTFTWEKCLDETINVYEKNIKLHF